MPLNAELMTDAIEAHLPALAETDARAARKASILAICQGICEHFLAAGVVTITFGPAPPASVVAAPPGGGPIVGVGLGTIT